jgi:hypothetical protein
MLTEATSYYEFDRMHRIDRIYYHIITIVSFADGVGFRRREGEETGN